LKKDRCLEQGAWLWRSTKQGPELLTAGVSALLREGLPISSPPLQERFGELGSWWKEGHWLVSARKMDVCSGAVPAPSCLLFPSVASVASLEGSQLWSYC